MNKYVLLCAAFLSSLTCLMNAEEERKGRELAADSIRTTMRAADEDAEVTKSCSSCCSTCGKCKTCSKCCCKSMTTKSMTTAEEVTKSCKKCCKTCGKCCGTCTSCKSVEMDEDTRCACGKPKPKAEAMEMEEARDDTE